MYFIQLFRCRVLQTSCQCVGLYQYCDGPRMGAPWRWPGRREVSLYGVCSGPYSFNQWASSQGELYLRHEHCSAGLTPLLEHVKLHSLKLTLQFHITDLLRMCK